MDNRNNNFINDFINQLDDTTGNIHSGNTSNYARKPYSPSSGTVVKSKYEYMHLILTTIRYNEGFGDAYITSYQSVIRFYLDKIEIHKEDLGYLENGIRKDIHNFKQEYNQTHRRSKLGEIDALELILNELLYCKHQLMAKIQNSINI